MSRIPQRCAARLLAGVTSAVALAATTPRRQPTQSAVLATRPVGGTRDTTGRRPTKETGPMGRRAVHLLVAVTLLAAGTIPGAAPAAADQAGITWTSQTIAADNGWHSVAYGGGLFVAVAFSGTGNRVMTSPDGITWTIRTSAADNSWRSVAYGGGLFVAVSFTGSGNRVMTSPDGITWTIRTSAFDNDWSSVTYAGGLFVAVSNSGTGNRVMTSGALSSGGSGGSAVAPVAPSVPVAPVPEPQSLPPVAGVVPATAVASGGSSGSVNGVPVETTIAVNPAGGVQVSGGGSTVVFADVDANLALLPAPSGGLVGPQGGGLAVIASGFLPQSQVDVYMYSEQLWLGKATVDAGGSAAMSLTIPSWVTPGGHTLQFVGYQGPYTSLALSTGITVTAVTALPSASGATTVYYRPGAVALRNTAKVRLWNAINTSAPGSAGAGVLCVAIQAKPRTASGRALWAQRKLGVTGFLTRAGCDTVTARLGDLAGIAGASNLAIRVTATGK